MLAQLIHEHTLTIRPKTQRCNPAPQPLPMSPATRETDSTIFTMGADSPIRDQRAPPMKAPPLPQPQPQPQPTQTQTSLSRSPTIQTPSAPHIRIEPWDGTPSSRQDFANQLRACLYFNPTAFPHDSARKIWAISFFRGHAADTVSGCMRHLINRERSSATAPAGRDVGNAEDEKNEERMPTTWREFLDVYLAMIGDRVLLTRRAEERRREAWGWKVLLFIWALTCALIYWSMMGALFIVAIVAVTLLIQVLADAAEKAGVLWAVAREGGVGLGEC